MRFSWLCFLLTFSLYGQTKAGRFIIELQEPSVLEAQLQAKQPARSASTERRTRVLAQQDKVLEHLFPRRVSVRGAVDTVANALIVDAPDISVLQNLPFVKSVRPARFYRLALDRALNVLRIPEAWARVGGRDMAGAGMKIAILDTGIDRYHLAFQDSSLTMPDGFPKFSTEGDRMVTSNKVIVARSYDGTSASDREGHGTGVAAAAAGVVHLGIRPDMGGVAPKAYLGAYRVSEGPDDEITDDALLRALDDAVKDGMDVINMSLSGPSLGPVEENILTGAVTRAVEAGVIVVVAAGNEGPDMLTVGDLGSIPGVITVGSSRSSWIPATPSLRTPNQTFAATPASNSEDAEPVTGQLLDVATLDRNGLGCNGFAGGSLQGKIAFILRGECTFEEKLNNAQAAGAIAAVVYNNVGPNADNPSGRVIMSVNTATLRALMVTRNDGLTLKAQIATEPGIEYSLSFRTSNPDDSGLLSGFSSRGPTLEFRIKPDLVAVGSNIWTASNGTIPGEPLSSSYARVSGTSLAAPLVAGAAAVLKQARPGLTASQYRSLLVNSTEPFPVSAERTSVLKAGAGRLDLNASLTSSLAAEPVSVSFGAFDRQSPEITREITLTNVSAEPVEVSLAIDSEDSLKPALSSSSLPLAAGASEKIRLAWSNGNPAAGEYQGFVVASTGDGRQIRIPYWLGVRSGEAKQISIFFIVGSTFRAGRSTQILFRVLDSANLPVNASPEVSVVSGGGSVVSTSRIANSGLAFVSEVRFGPEPGLNIFKFKAGDAEQELRINATR
jgi:subtilisin family serine protease